MPAVASAQSPAPPAQGQAPAATAGAATPAVAVEPQGFDYDPEGRRDPFVSLMRRGTDTARSAPSTRAPRPWRDWRRRRSRFGERCRAGERIRRHPRRAPTDRTYIVRVGDRLLDGTIRSITPNAIVILQQVNDPLSLEKQREVRKMIRQADEAK